MKLYRCPICGRVEIVKEGETKDLICCGKIMEELEPHTVDAAFEKHVPYCVVENNKINVSVGEVLHPMTEEHYIVFIACLTDEGLNKIDLKPGMEPKATFDFKKGSKIFAYCNLHGLWECNLV